MSSVFIVDARELVRLALTKVIDAAPELQLGGAHDDASAAGAAIASSGADVVIIGDGAADRSLRLCRALARNSDRYHIVMGAEGDRASRGAMLLAGADEVFDLTDPVDVIVDRVRHRTSSGPVLEPEVTADLFDRLRSGAGPVDPMATLTDRESQILDLVSEGMTNPEIAAELHLSPKTVKNNVSTILKKLGMHTRTEAAVFAARREHAAR